MSEDGEARTNKEENKMNQLVFNQDGLSKAKTLMRYSPDPANGMGDWNILYLVAESRFTVFARLVMTEAESGVTPDVTFNQIGESARYVKFSPRMGNEHVPHEWVRPSSSFNVMYIPKSHPFAQKETLYIIFNYGGVPPVSDSKSELHLITGAKGEGKVSKIPMPNAQQRARKMQDEEVPIEQQVTEALDRQEQREADTLSKHNSALIFKQVISEALIAAQAAGKAQEDEVDKRKGVGLVDSFTGNHVGTLKDDCGYAWIVGIDARKGFGLAFKKMAQSDRRLFYGDKKQSGLHVSNTQYMSAKKAAAEAFVEVVNEKCNLDLYVITRVD